LILAPTPSRLDQGQKVGPGESVACLATPEGGKFGQSVVVNRKFAIKSNGLTVSPRQQD
jgi:hypothetical protein